MKTWLAFLIGVMTALTSPWVFAASKVITDVGAKLTVNQDGDHELNISRLVGNRDEVSGVKIRAKSDLGGSQIYLFVNDILTNGGVIDTDPALYESNSGYAELYLQNYERALRSGGQDIKLVLTPAHNAKIQSVEIIYGEAQGLVTTKDYKNPLVTVAGGQGAGGPPVTLPPLQPAQPVQPVRPAVVLPQHPVQTVQKDCVPQRSGQLICVGDRVRNRLGEYGVIRAVFHVSPSQVTVVFEGRDPITRDADYVLLLSR